MSIVSPEELARIVGERQGRGERIVFTNGVFDLLHLGHVRYLTEARALGEALVVAVNEDASVQSFKGDLRPIVPQGERAALLDALRAVDYVTLFGTRTPVPLIEQIRPAIYVKGGDYTLGDLPETSVVRSYGGDVRILGLVPGRSTTNMIAKICAAAAQNGAAGEG